MRIVRSNEFSFCSCLEEDARVAPPTTRTEHVARVTQRTVLYRDMGIVPPSQWSADPIPGHRASCKQIVTKTNLLCSQDSGCVCSQDFVASLAHSANWLHRDPAAALRMVLDRQTIQYSRC